MGVLDQITQMRQTGMSEDEIISQLKQQGTSPKAINEAMDQSQIKSAVVEENIDPSIKGEVPPAPPEAPVNYAGQAREMGSEYMPQPTQQATPASEGTYASEEYYPEEDYPEYGGYGEYAPSAGIGTGTFIEIAEQVFVEKIRDIEKHVESLSEFKSLAQVQLDHALERITRVESMMDKLQIAILDKIGSYGKTLESIKKEMSMMQDSFRKTLPKIASQQTSTQTTPTRMTKRNFRKK